MPGVPVGTTNTDAWRWGRPSGLVSANTRTMSATEALVMNHLWPSITHSSPSLVAVVPMTVGIGAGQEGLGQGEGAGDLAPQVGPQPALLLGVGRTVGQQLHVPAVGCLHPEDRHRHHAAADDLGHQGQLELTQPLAAELRVEEGAPQALGLDLVLEMGLDHAPLVGGQLVEDGLERDQLPVDEGPHPGELLLELRLRLEVPRHDAAPVLCPV